MYARSTFLRVLLGKGGRFRTFENRLKGLEQIETAFRRKLRFCDLTTQTTKNIYRLEQDVGTDSTKINRPGHNIRMYWTNYWEPTAHVQQNIFGKTFFEVCSPHLYASFGIIHVQIGQLFAAQWVFKQSEEFRYRRHFPSKTANCRFSNILQRLTVPRIIDQFWLKRCQKKRKDVDYKLL